MRYALALLVVFCFTEATSAQCGSQRFFGRLRSRFVHRERIIQRTPLAPRLIGLSGGCNPVFAPAAACAAPAAAAPKVETPKKK